MEEVLAYMNIFPDEEAEVTEPDTTPTEPETDEQGSTIPTTSTQETTAPQSETGEVFTGSIIDGQDEPGHGVNYPTEPEGQTSTDNGAQGEEATTVAP